MHLPHSASLKDQFDRMALGDCGGHKCVQRRQLHVAQPNLRLIRYVRFHKSRVEVIDTHDN